MKITHRTLTLEKGKQTRKYIKITYTILMGSELNFQQYLVWKFFSLYECHMYVLVKTHLEVRKHPLIALKGLIFWPLVTCMNVEGVFV